MFIDSVMNFVQAGLNSQTDIIDIILLVWRPTVSIRKYFPEQIIDNRIFK